MSGEAVIAALEAIRQPLVVETEQVHHRGLEVVNVNFVLGDAETEFVGAAVVESSLHTAAGHEERVAVG
jgi:hypothetical protein